MEVTMSERSSKSPLFAALGVASLRLLGACTPLPDWHAVAKQSEQIHAICETQHPDSALATEQCANSQIGNLYKSVGFPDMDVIDAYLAKREAIAARKDRKIISTEDARADFAQALAEENTLLQQRAASRAQLNAASSPFFCDRVGFHSMVCD
jgi:hypothetical protein